MYHEHNNGKIGNGDRTHCNVIIVHGLSPSLVLEQQNHCDHCFVEGLEAGHIRSTMRHVQKMSCVIESGSICEDILPNQRENEHDAYEKY